MSIPPHSATVWSTRFCSSSLRAIWHGITTALPPLARMPAATASQASGLRLEITTVAPCSAMRLAIARPIPLVEPVTMATFPVRSNSDDIAWRPFAGGLPIEYAARLGNVNQPRMQTKRTSVYSREQLTRLLHPHSIAVIGASTRAGSFGKRVLHNMRHYGGRAYPVNARYERIGEQPAIPMSRRCRRCRTAR